MVITTKQGVKLLITRGCVGLLKIKVSSPRLGWSEVIGTQWTSYNAESLL